MTATVGTAITPVNQITLCHYPVTIFHIKILFFLKVVRKIIRITKNIIEIIHGKQFLQN